MRILIFNVLGSGNRGDLAIIESEIQEMQRIAGNAEISISAVFPKTLETLLPGIRVVPSLVDMPTVCADSKARDRKSFRYLFYIGLYSVVMLFQCGLALGSAMISTFFSKTLYRPEVIAEFKNADLVIFNGGEAFKEGSVFLSDQAYAKQKPVWWIYLFQKLWIMLIIARVFKKPIVVFPNTVGPMRTSIGRYLIKTMVRCTKVFMVRDAISASTLRNMGIENFVQTSDIVLLLENDETSSRVTLPKHTIGVSPGLFDLSSNQELKQKYLLAHAKALDYLIEHEGFNIVFLPSNLRHDIKNNDLAISQLIIGHMQQKNKVQIVRASSARELLTVLKQLDLLVATRMHPTILASTKNVPFVSVIYDHKQLGFLSEIGLESCGFVVNDISSEKLLSKIMFVLTNKDDIKRTMLSNVLMLQENTRRKIDACIKALIDFKKVSTPN
jgi:polysaccharide pyruvyl transferase WcaK-like protein